MSASSCVAPLVILGANMRKYRAMFSGSHVYITFLMMEDRSWKIIFQQCTFGKGTISRSHPIANRLLVYRKRQLRLRRKLSEQINACKIAVVVLDSDASDEEYLTNMKPELFNDFSGQVEYVHLLFEEAYFLCNLGCLEVHERNDVTIEFNSLCRQFRDGYPDFFGNYAIYHYFRSRNWIVKSGAKYGADYLLYRTNPEDCHSEYVVVVDILDTDLERIVSPTRCISRSYITALVRECEIVGKQLTIACLIIPKGEDLAMPTYDRLTSYQVKEIHLDRSTIIDENPDSSYEF